VSTGNQQSLQRYAQPLYLATAKDDNSVPFSYKDWYNSHQGVIPGQEFKQYNEYLINWYKSKSQIVTDTKLQLKLNYLTLLNQLQLFFTNEEAENWYNKVNINNEKELLLSIPYFAKKLKDISLYYLQLRETVKKNRIKYNQTGTDTGIIQQLQDFLLTNYTQKPNTSISIPSSIWRNVPELSAVKDTINIQIEELYDTNSYFDNQPDLPTSTYYDLTNRDLQEFLTTRGLSISSTEWIYKLGVNSLSAASFELEPTALSASEIYQESIYNNLLQYSDQLAKKYLGSDKYISLSTTSSAQQDTYSIAIQSANNFFYWPYGVYPEKASTLPRYQPVKITDAGLETIATAGSSIEIADTIFVKTTRGIEGAWLQNKFNDYKTATMEAALDASKKTIFRYPFPGYGLSAEDIAWTGYGLKSDPRYFYLDDKIKQGIQEAYWTNSVELTSTNPLLINDTTLLASKSYSNRDYNKADKIKIWPQSPAYNDASRNGEDYEAWLYRFDKTDIPLLSAGDSVIVWPFEKIDPENNFPSYYPKDLPNVCLPVAVSAIDFSFAIAGNALSSSDVIYKISNYKDTKDLAVECCWLSGTDISITGLNTSTYIGDLQTIQQSSLQGVFLPGTYTNFIWNGPDNTDADTVFKTLKHQPDCKFVTTPNTTYLDYKLCNCSQVYNTPFGHPGDNLTDYGSFADVIAIDTFSPGKFDASNWVGPGGASALTSPNFAWYKTNNTQGWGDGSWYSGSSVQGNKMYLRTGYKYVYYRTNVRTTDKELVTLPDYSLKYNFNNYLKQYNSKYKWIKGVKNENNEWNSSNTTSSMTFYPGDILLYSRAGSTTYNLVGSTTTTQDISENRGSIWSNYDYISIGKNSIGLEKQIAINYPSSVYIPASAFNQNDVYKQYPASSVNNILSIFAWALSAPDRSVQVFRNIQSLSFTPSLTGLYTTSLTAVTATSLGLTSYSAATSGFYIFTNIPPVTAIPTTATVPSLTSFSTPTPGYILNTPLRGWDYNAGTYNIYASITNSGARPFWAKSYSDKNSKTGYKGIPFWGTPQRCTDCQNIITQPEISDLTLKAGSYIEYNRTQSSSVNWIQPIDLTVTVNENKWCTLNFTTTSESNLGYQLNNFSTELVVTPTTATSNLSIQNYIDNQPTEIYYNAIKPFTWDITVNSVIEEIISRDTSVTQAIEAAAPWANLSNQFYPTVAAFPAFNNLYSPTKIGGFFTPSNLGISVYTDQDYTTNVTASSKALTSYFEDSKNIVAGRGLTYSDQPTPYENVIENNVWLKEPTTSGPIAGTIKKDVFKKYQKFLPYQSGYETNPRLRVGLITPTSRQTPWGGKEDSVWTDLANKPTSFTGELNVKAWADTQILKQAELQVDNWVTDVFGNQYGLYKDLRNVEPVDRKNTTGEIWTRKNSQFTSPAYISLAGVFDTYTNTSIINELTGTGIRKIDMFFDTLFVETSGAVIFEKIIYDYDADNIFSLADESRYLSLAIPVTISNSRELAGNMNDYTYAKAGETWFFPEQKLATVSVCGLKDSILTPELYQLDLNNQKFKKVFPVTSEDFETLSELTTLNLTYIDSPVLSHNELKKEYLLVILGKNNDNQDVVIELKIKDLSVIVLDGVTVYSPNTNTSTSYPPYITQTLATDITIDAFNFTNALNFQCVAQNIPALFTPYSVPDWVSLSIEGLFTGTPPKVSDTYYATFIVSNAAGPAYYTLNINVTYISSIASNYLILEDEIGFLLQEDDSKIVESTTSI
jgi:hypothetical protein